MVGTGLVQGVALVDVDECVVYQGDTLVGLWQPLVFSREREELSPAVLLELGRAGACLGCSDFAFQLHDVQHRDGRNGFMYWFHGAGFYGARCR